jgi:hypothetical protein
MGAEAITNLSPSALNARSQSLPTLHPVAAKGGNAIQTFSSAVHPLEKERKEAAMISEAIGDPIEDRILMQEHRSSPSRRTLLRKALIGMGASAMLGVAAIAPNAALAFGPPPLPGIGGPPPLAGLGGPPPGLAGPPPGVGGLPHPGLGAPHGVGGPAGAPRVAGLPGFRGGAHDLQGNFQGRAAASSYGRSAGHSYGRSGAYSYGRNRYRGVYFTGSYGSSSADDSCYYTYRRNRRVVVCTSE